MEMGEERGSKDASIWSGRCRLLAVGYWESKREVGESQAFHLAGSVQGWDMGERQVGSRRVEGAFGNSRFCKVPWGSCVGSWFKR